MHKIRRRRRRRRRRRKRRRDKSNCDFPTNLPICYVILAVIQRANAGAEEMGGKLTMEEIKWMVRERKWGEKKDT